MALTMTNKRLTEYFMLTDNIARLLFRTVGVDSNGGLLFDQDTMQMLEFEGKQVIYGLPFQYPHQITLSLSDKKMIDWFFKAYIMKCTAEEGVCPVDAYGPTASVNNDGNRLISYFIDIHGRRYYTNNYEFEACAIMEMIIILSSDLIDNSAMMRDLLKRYDELLSILIAGRKTNQVKRQRSGLF